MNRNVLVHFMLFNLYNYAILSLRKYLAPSFLFTTSCGLSPPLCTLHVTDLCSLYTCCPGHHLPHPSFALCIFLTPALRFVRGRFCLFPVQFKLFFPEKNLPIFLDNTEPCTEYPDPSTADKCHRASLVIMPIGSTLQELSFSISEVFVLFCY